MSNKQKLIMINRTVEKLGLQIGSPLWYELISLTVEGVNNTFARPMGNGRLDLLITPEKDTDNDRIEKELETLFNNPFYDVIGITINIVVSDNI